jgi:hypothetical protein
MPRVEISPAYLENSSGDACRRNTGSKAGKLLDYTRRGKFWAVVPTLCSPERNEATPPRAVEWKRTNREAFVLDDGMSRGGLFSRPVVFLLQVVDSICKCLPSSVQLRPRHKWPKSIVSADHSPKNLDRIPLGLVERRIPRKNVENLLPLPPLTGPVCGTVTHCHLVPSPHSL